MTADTTSGEGGFFLQIRETALGAIHPGIMTDTVVASQNSKRVAYVAAENGKAFVVVDGGRGKGYDAIGTSPIACGDGRIRVFHDDRWPILEEINLEDGWYAIDLGISLIFSSDGKHIAYPAQDKGDWLVVRDGVECKRYDWIEGGSLTYSPDGERLAYVAVKEDRKRLLVVDDEEGTEYYWANEVVFSPDSRRVAYQAQRSQDKWFVVADGEEGPDYEAVVDVVFSPDSQHVAYLVQREDKQLVVVDGMGQVECDGVLTWPPFWRSNDHLPTYSIARGDSCFVIANGTEDPTGNLRDAIPLIVANGTKVIWWGMEGFVLDGMPEANYDMYCEPFASPDGGHVAFVARRNGKRLLVHDGVEGSQYDAIGIGVPDDEIEASDRPWALEDEQPIFSPNGKRLAYRARRGNKWLMVVDGDEGTEYHAVGRSSYVFSPDSRHLAYTAKRGDKWVVVVDGRETPGYDAFVPSSHLVFDTANSLHALGLKDDAFLLIQIGILEANNGSPK
jgi:hypothetical protein